MPSRLQEKVPLARCRSLGGVRLVQSASDQHSSTASTGSILPSASRGHEAWTRARRPVGMLNQVVRPIAAGSGCMGAPSDPCWLPGGGTTIDSMPSRNSNRWRRRRSRPRLHSSGFVLQIDLKPPLLPPRCQVGRDAGSMLGSPPTLLRGQQGQQRQQGEQGQQGEHHQQVARCIPST